MTRQYCRKTLDLTFEDENPATNSGSLTAVDDEGDINALTPAGANGDDDAAAHDDGSDNMIVCFDKPSSSL